MYDVIVRGGFATDGTGADGRAADVAVRDGRIVAIGGVDESARRTIDADGLVVAPGFVDVHTHYDAQAFWDPTLSPSPLHGVTTVVGGNCGFTLAPMAPSEADYLVRMLARVEGMPLESLRAGVPLDWSSTGEYLDRLDGTLAVNAGFLVGHSALRRVVMGAGSSGPANAEQIEAMRRLLHEGLAAGGLGFSSTWSTSHNDHFGEPVPSRHATPEELVALCSVVRDHAGTTLEFLPGVGEFSDDLVDLMAAMSRAADRPLNWNALVVYGKNRERTNQQLAASDRAEARGGRVVALTLPDSLRTRLTFKSGFVLDMLPGWADVMAMPDGEKLAVLADPDRRAWLGAQAETATGVQRTVAHWGAYVILETFSPETKRFEGRTVGEIATELGQTPWEALAEIVVADRLRTAISQPDRGQDDESWRRRVEVWRDPRTVVGASDAGAHLDMIDSFSYTMTLLGRAVREHALLPVEEAIFQPEGRSRLPADEVKEVRCMSRWGVG